MPSPRLPRAPSFTDSQIEQTIGAFEREAKELRRLIATQSPLDLLGYIYATTLMASMAEPARPSVLPNQDLEHAQFLLEYVHATWASTPPAANASLDDSTCAQIVSRAADLRGKALTVAMMIAARSPESQFGEWTQSLQFQALSIWVLLRGHRYQVLEEEFFALALAPHDAALRRAYGVGAAAIAQGLQAAADAVRLGHDNAVQTMRRAMEDSAQFLADRQLSPDEGLPLWREEHADVARAATDAYSDLLRGGICNLSRHTNLPPALLADMAYVVGEEVDFFSPGPFAGTPFRSLPVRKRPLIKIRDEFYLVDPSFVRDAAYRLLLHRLIEREPDYAATFRDKQKAWSEQAFVEILAPQLQGATVLHEVYYRSAGNWFENDTLVLLDGVLLLVEAKSGAAATIASPVDNFDRHARAVHDLVVKAHAQCQRFLEYLASADEVPLFALRDGHHIEVARIRLADYPLVLPIGLTVESFSPFSTSAKLLPGVTPLLGKHPFISVSIDELLVLTRLLPTTGALIHYLRNRQAAEGAQELLLVDEFDHLGAYLRDNLFVDALARERAQGANLIIIDGASDVVDQYFAQPDWATTAPPSQPMPSELQDLLDALAREKAPGWIDADNTLRDFGFEGRELLSRQLARRREALAKRDDAYVALRTDAGLFVWMHRDGVVPDRAHVEEKACALAEAFDVGRVLLVIAGVDSEQQYVAAEARWVMRRPHASESILELAAELRRSAADLTRSSTPPPGARRKIGRNDRCPCGSGRKYKRCHGS